jgi:hypothetical protein
MRWARSSLRRNQEDIAYASDLREMLIILVLLTRMCAGGLQEDGVIVQNLQIGGQR